MFERSRKGENALLIQPHAGPLDEAVLEEFQELASSAGASIAAVVTARIEHRFDAMLAAGFVDEVSRLRALPQLASHPRPLDLPALRAVGYRQAWEHLEGRFDAADLRERGVHATRQLAKRQLTWLRSEWDALRFDPATDRARLDRAVADFLGGS